jgi:predicted DNA-binding protein
VSAQLNVRLPAELVRRVRVDAAEQGRRPRDVVREALEDRYGLVADDPPPVIDGQLKLGETA